MKVVAPEDKLGVVIISDVKLFLKTSVIKKCSSGEVISPHISLICLIELKHIVLVIFLFNINQLLVF